VSAGLRCMCHGVSYTTVSAYLAAHPGAMRSPEQLELELGDAVSRHPAGRLYVGTFEDGSQVLVEEHIPGRMTVAVRPQRSAVWGPPTFLDETL
jgi:hypothetical protein